MSVGHRGFSLRGGHWTPPQPLATEFTPSCADPPRASEAAILAPSVWSHKAEHPQITEDSAPQAGSQGTVMQGLGSSPPASLCALTP